MIIRFYNEIDFVKILEANGYSQKTFAKKVRVSEAYISQVANNRRTITSEVWEKWKKKTGI